MLLAIYWLFFAAFNLLTLLRYRQLQSYGRDTGRDVTRTISRLIDEMNDDLARMDHSLGQQLNRRPIPVRTWPHGRPVIPPTPMALLRPAVAKRMPGAHPASPRPQHAEHLPAGARA